MFLITQPIFLGLILVCLFLSFFSYDPEPLKTRRSIFFSCLLIVELVCYWFKLENWNNVVIYNLWFPIEFIFYTYWILEYVDNKRVVSIFRKMSVGYLAVVVIIIIVKQSLYSFNGLAYQTGFLLLLPALLYKLNEMIKEQAMINPLRNPVFWLVTGLLFSYLFSFCQFSIQEYLINKSENLNQALKKLNIVLTDVLYICFILFFIFKWKDQKLHTS